MVKIVEGVLCVVGELIVLSVYCFFCKQKTAYEMRISDWSSDVCSSDLAGLAAALEAEIHLYGRVPDPDQSGNGSCPHQLFAGGRPDGPPVVHRSQSPEHPHSPLPRPPHPRRLCRGDSKRGV